MPADRPESRDRLRSLAEAIALRDATPLAALGRATSLTPRALVRLVAELERAGLVEYDRAAKAVGLNAGYGCAAAIDLGASNLRLVLADFRGRWLAAATERVRPEDGPRPTIGRIKQGVRRLLLSAAHGREGKGPALRSLAIGVPSPVDPERGWVAFANNLPGWRNIDLGRELAKAFRVPVRVENDANMAAIGEHWRGVAQGARNFVFIALGTGIGSGIFTGGELYRGRTGNAGELYRLNVEWQRWNEDFGDVGYFESQVAGLGIAAEGRRRLGSARRSGAGLVEQRDARFVFERFHRGDRAARRVLERAFTILGVGVANVVAILDPDLIVFGGGVVKGAPQFLLATVERVVRRIHPDIAPPLQLSALGDKAQIYGAIRSALEAAREAALARLQATTRKSSAAPPRGGGT